MMFRTTCAALAILAVFFSATPAGAVPRQPWTIPGTLRIAVGSEPNTLNPVLQTQVVESFIESFIFDGLVKVFADGSIEPRLATVVPTEANGGISRDGRTLTFHLRSDVKWHDGTPFTSADVAFTQSARMNSANNVTNRSPWDLVDRLDTPDARTVVVHLKERSAPFVALWATSRIIPAHVLATLPDLNHADFSGSPLGTGPFMFERWTRGTEVVLKANPAYYGGRPKLDRIIIRLMPDQNTQLIALRTHEIDMVSGSVPRFRDVANVDPTLRVVAYDLNEVFGITINVTDPLLGDRRIRQAISHAINRQVIASKAMHDLVTPATGDIPQNMWAADRSLPQQFDPAASRSLLSQAGWKIGSDGIAVKSGARLSVTLTYGAGNATGDSIVLLIQAMLHDVGIELALKPVQGNTMFASAAAGGLLPSGQFQLAISGFATGPDPDDSVRFTCAQVAPVGNNYSRWCNPDYDALARRATSVDDRPTRRAMYSQLERLLVSEVPIVFLWWPKAAEIISVDMKDFEFSQHHDLRDPEHWSI